ncbi:undecaprenyl-diphosphate phosphatase [Xylanibacillus composti]|uniref:Undecaprenyl-diphosphatase n=1 Tax=Xylanibacillus composti TaxID=1572762 RepID=A0A8J4GZQ8_9BACL|nr:undecaprenyl-diphosphate phosphatase [Xylanibacillus composti]MDT9724938.1 undecaprenyl-diphosphate phosphatase [Xylanibacillus composti]GIQ68174.1 undecaprenyl-diphosphatase 2 [Xylanibacillus composti]
MEELLLIIKYAVMGVVQGFTEPIPISSSGHVVIIKHLFGIEVEGLSFEVFVNFASLLAVLIIYRKDIVQMVAGVVRFVRTRDADSRKEFNFFMYLVLATIPAGVIGVLLGDVISNSLSGIHVIGFALLVTSVALWAIRNLRGRRQDADLSVRDAIIVGLGQAVALIPGISRSGATIVAAMALGMKQETALKFSFFLYIPISLGGMVLEAPTLAEDLRMNSNLIVPYILAFFTSLIASYYSLRWFMGIMARGNLKYFAMYCLVAGLAVIFFL